MLGLLAQFAQMLTDLPWHHVVPGIRLQGRKVVWRVILVEGWMCFGLPALVLSAQTALDFVVLPPRPALRQLRSMGMKLSALNA